RLKQRSRVLLPHPDGPISAVIRFRGISMVIAFSASAGPYQTESPRVDNTIGSAEAAETVVAVGTATGRVAFMGSARAWGRFISLSVVPCPRTINDNVGSGCESRWPSRSSRAGGRPG